MAAGPRSPLPALARWVSGAPRQALAVVAVATVAFGVCAREVRLDNNFAGLFSTSSADARFREEYRRTFGADDGLLVAVLDAERPSEEMFAAVDAISSRVADLPGVEHVDSVTTLAVARPPDGGITRDIELSSSLVPAFSDATADLSLDERIALAHDSRLGPGHVISADGRTTLVVANMAARYDSYEEIVDPAGRFRDAVERELGDADVDGLDVHFAGVAYTRIDAIAEMQGDLLKLFPVATVAMAALLWWFFRRVVAVVATMAAIVASVVATAGVIGLAGDDINQVTIIYPVLLMGVVVATSTHVLHRYYRERAAGAGPEDAARLTIERIGRAAVVCTITNAIGFVSLVTARMRILHEFGLYLAAGVVFCLIATTLVIPALLVLRRSEPSERYRREWGPESIAAPDVDSWSARFAWTVTGPRSSIAIVAVGVLLVIGSVLVGSTARFDYSLSGMLDAGRPASVGNALVDERLSGIVPIEISVKGGPGEFASVDSLDRLSELDAWLAAEEGLNTVGVPSALEAMASLGFVVPSDDTVARTLLTALVDMPAEMGAPIGRLITPDLSHTRLRSFHPDTGSTDVVELAERIDAKGAELFEGTDVRVRVTGEAPVAYEGMNELARELMVATIVAVILIVIAIGIAFRSVLLALAALLPNVAPIAVGVAIYTLARDVLDPVPGVVFCVAMGLAADDTVHLFNRYRELLPDSLSPREALADALVSVRRAMVSSSVVLVASFLALGISGFPTNRTLGVLGALLLTLALGSDMLFGTAGLAIVSRRHAARAGSVQQESRILPTPAAQNERAEGWAGPAIEAAE